MAMLVSSGPLVHRPLSNSHFFQKPTPPEFSEVKLGLRVALVYNDNACLHKKLARLNGRTTSGSLDTIVAISQFLFVALHGV